MNPVGHDNAAVIRALIQHEDNVLNSRFGWFGTMQGFLLGALAFAWDKHPSALVYVLAAVGTVVAMSTLYATTTAVQTMKELTFWWDAHRPAAYEGPDVIGHRVTRWRFRLLRPSIALPVTVAIAWLSVTLAKALGP